MFFDKRSKLFASNVAKCLYQRIRRSWSFLTNAAFFRKPVAFMRKCIFSKPRKCNSRSKLIIQADQTVSWALCCVRQWYLVHHENLECILEALQCYILLRANKKLTTFTIDTWPLTHSVFGNFSARLLLVFITCICWGRSSKNHPISDSAKWHQVPAASVSL